MTAKSILEVDVSTAEFQRYKALFDQYTDQLKKQPALWAAVAKQHKALGTQFQHTADALDEEHNKLEDVSKINEANEKRLEKSKGLWADMSKSSESFAKNLTSASGFLSKWGGLLFGGIVGGAAFGIDRAVHDASSNRQQAMGLGVSVGALKAFSANYGRIGDTDSLLNSVNAMETDGNQRESWYALGLGNMTGDTVKDTMKYLDAERKFAQRTPLSQLGTYSRALDLRSDPQQLRLMGDTKDPEWNKMGPGTLADMTRMNVPGSKALQDLSTQFARNMSIVGSAFETQLARAAPLLGTFSGWLAKITANEITRTGNDLASWVNKAKTDKVGAYMDLMLLPFRTATSLAKTSWDAYGSLVAPPVSNALTNFSNWAVPTPGSITGSPAAYNAYLGRLDLANGFPKGLLEAVKFAESSNFLYPHPSSKGAIGAFQFMPDTAKELGIDPHDPMQSASGAATYFKKLRSEFAGDLEKMLAANNWGPGNLAADIKAHGKDWLRFAPKETQDYVRKIEVIVQNNTGGSTTVAANQLAH